MGEFVFQKEFYFQNFRKGGNPKEWIPGVTGKGRMPASLRTGRAPRASAKVPEDCYVLCFTLFNKESLIPSEHLFTVPRKLEGVYGRGVTHEPWLPQTFCRTQSRPDEGRRCRLGHLPRELQAPPSAAVPSSSWLMLKNCPQARRAEAGTIPWRSLRRTSVPTGGTTPTRACDSCGGPRRMLRRNSDPRPSSFFFFFSSRWICAGAEGRSCCIRNIAILGLFPVRNTSTSSDIFHGSLSLWGRWPSAVERRAGAGVRSPGKGQHDQGRFL